MRKKYICKELMDYVTLPDMYYHKKSKLIIRIGSGMILDQFNEEDFYERIYKAESFFKKEYPNGISSNECKTVYNLTIKSLPEIKFLLGDKLRLE
ncbi:hypothetical protein [Haemophilus haemolyticus]|uniref:hypothetical protein n=1 Tax=Haemophilus haemolyticus TaxID=726 RepID=UPI00129065B0|nr:hypothetical protein [Haemophilus haemolyticus]